MKFDIFSELDAARIEQIKAASKYVELPKGSILFYEGDVCESVLYLTEDEINILVGGADEKFSADTALRLLRRRVRVP